MKRSTTAVLLAALTTTTVVAYGHTRHRHVHRARPDARRAPTYYPAYSEDMAYAVDAAAVDGNVPRLRALFARGGRANWMVENGLSPLIEAARNAHVDAVRFLIAHGAYLYGVDNGEDSALDSAETAKRYTTDPGLRAKYDKVFAVLINAGAEALDDAVWKAASAGDAARLLTLFAKGARIDLPMGNPLILAAKGAHVGAVRVLLNTGEAVFNRPAPNGTTILDDAEVQQRRASDPTLRAKYARIIALLGTRAAAADDPDTPQAYQKGRQTLQRETAKAKRIARERYKFVHWFASKTGLWPISRMIGDYTDTVAFPLGRSDRMYVLLLPGYWSDGREVDWILCYQRKNGKNKLVYRVTFEQQDRIATKARPIKAMTRDPNLLASVTGENSYFEGNVKHIGSDAVQQGSRFAREDLANLRDYVLYDSDLTINALQLSPHSARPNASTFGDASYYLDEDPFTQAKLRHDDSHEDFYRRYGLPVAPAELAMIGGP